MDPYGYTGALYRPKSLGDLGLYKALCKQAGSMMAHAMPPAMPSGWSIRMVLADSCCVSLVFLGALYRPKSLGDLGLYSYYSTQAGSMMAHRMTSQTIHLDGLAGRPCVSLVFLGAVYRPDSLGESGLFSHYSKQAGSMMAHGMAIRMAIRMVLLRALLNPYRY